MALMKGVGILALVAFLYYGSIWAFLLFSPFLFWYLKRWEREMEKKKQQEFRRQFQEAIRSLGAALNVGYSLENAMREAKKDLDVLYEEDAMIQREFSYMLRQIYLQIPMEQILEEWAVRTGQEDVRNFVNVFATARRNGGNMVEIIQHSITQIRDKMEVHREIETFLAARKYEFKVMSAIPFCIIAYMKLSFPEFIHILYGNVIGVGVMSLCLAVYAGAYYLGEKIVNIEI